MSGRSRGLLTRVLLLSLALAPVGIAQEGDLAARKRARLKDPAADFWIYDDVEKGYAEAKKRGQPLLVSFRCVP